MGHVNFLHSRLGGHVEPEQAAASSAPARPVPTGDFATIRCRAAVTGLHAANLVADIADAAAQSRHVVVDLSLTASIDATGLGALVSGARACRDAGSGFHLVGAHGMVAQALRFTGLSRALSTHATVEDALSGS